MTITDSLYKTSVGDAGEYVDESKKTIYWSLLCVYI